MSATPWGRPRAGAGARGQRVPAARHRRVLLPARRGETDPLDRSLPEGLEPVVTAGATAAGDVAVAPRLFRLGGPPLPGLPPPVDLLRVPPEVTPGPAAQHGRQRRLKRVRPPAAPRRTHESWC